MKTSYDMWLERKGHNSRKRKTISAVFRRENSKEEVKEEFECVNIDNDAFKSYCLTVSFFNETLRPHEQRRIAIKAEWVTKK